MDEAANVVFCGVGAEALFTVLFDAKADVVSESYVETAGAAGEDVDVEVIFPLRHFQRITEESAGRKADSSASLRNDKQKGKCEGKDNCNCNCKREKQIPPLRCGMTNKRASAIAGDQAGVSSTSCGGCSTVRLSWPQAA